MQWQIVKRVAELDAIFAYLYGLNTEDLRYILDPKDICRLHQRDLPCAERQRDTPVRRIPHQTPRSRSLE